MKKLAIPLSVLAVALAGCVTYDVQPANTFTSAAIAPNPIAWHTGTGVVSKITASPSYASSGATTTTTTTTTTAGAGSTTVQKTVRPGYPYNRLVVTMDNGAVQYVDTDSNDFRSGMRVELMPDRTIRPLFPR
jgi:hypothetical protein